MALALFSPTYRNHYLFCHIDIVHEYLKKIQLTKIDHPFLRIEVVQP
jgi:hypothetical protein